MDRLKKLMILLAFWPLVSMGVPLPEMDCLIEPNTVTDLSSSVNGVVQEIFVERGDSVKKGQKLVQLENSVELANVALAKAKALYSEDINAAEIQVKYTRKKLKRIDALYSKKAMSVSEHQDAQNNSEIALVDRHKAKHAKQLAELELNRAKRSLERMIIKSPIDGMIVEKYLSKGEAVEDKNILRIAEINPLKVEVIVPAQFFGEIKKGMKAILVPEILEKSVEAEVTLVDKVIDASSGTFFVRLRLPNPKHSLPGGLKCKVTFDNGEMPLQDNISNLNVNTPEYGFQNR